MMDNTEAPNALDAEQELLGCILIANDAAHRAFDFLRLEHFYEPLHGRIYAEAKRLIESGRRATPSTLKQSFEHEPMVGELTVAQYLGRLAANASSPRALQDLARTIFDMSARREAMRVAVELHHKASTLPIDASVDGMIEDTEVALALLAERGFSSSHLVPITDAVTDAINLIAAAYQRDGGLVGLPTGLRDLDAKTGGLAAGELVIIAGRPSMGKSALAAGVAVHNAHLAATTKGSEDPRGCAVAFFSLEMSAVQIVLRLIAQGSKLSAHRLRSGQIEASDFDAMLVDDGVVQRLAKLPIYFDDTGGLNIAQLCARARRLKRQKDVGLIVVDYLQLVRANVEKGGGKQREISEVSDRLKALARELEIPVLALSQLSREVEKRDDKRPTLSDLRDSGSIEQDADNVIFVYREDYYLERAEPQEGTARHAEWQRSLNDCKGLARLIIAKQRQGPIGVVTVAFDAQTARFRNIASQVAAQFNGGDE